MGIETYILIAACYGLGCYLSHKAGLRRGVAVGVEMTLQELSEVCDKTTIELAQIIKDHRTVKALKATRS